MTDSANAYVDGYADALDGKGWRPPTDASQYIQDHYKLGYELAQEEIV